MDKTIFHIDVNSAYLSWEAVYRKSILGETDQDLRDIPSIVGGSVESRHGIVLAKSIPAKRYNIKTGEAVWQAQQKCPNLVVVPPHYSLYERCSYEFIQLLKEYAPIIEQYSIDECWCDVTGTSKLYGSPIVLANLIKDRTFHELGFSVNIGVSSNKLLAKVASDFQKPNRVHSLYPDEIRKKMWPLPVADLFYCGPATKKKLNNIGIKTIGELAQMDIQYLKKMMGKHGELIWAYANGLGETNLVPIPLPNKGYGNSTTISFDVCDTKMAKHVLLSLCETVCSRLRKDNVQAGVVSVAIKNNLFEYSSHQEKLLTPTNTTLELYEHAAKLFSESWDHSPIRHLGVHTSQVQNNYYSQLNLFDRNYEKYNRADRSMDKIRKRYGNAAIQRACFLHSPIPHMAGGITTDKFGPTTFDRRDSNCKRIFQST